MDELGIRFTAKATGVSHDDGSLSAFVEPVGVVVRGASLDELSAKTEGALQFFMDYVISLPDPGSALKTYLERREYPYTTLPSAHPVRAPYISRPTSIREDREVVARA